MSYKKLRKIPFEVHNINDPGTPDPRFHRVTTTVPAKEFTNTRGDMQVLDLYLHGPLKFKDVGACCANCVNYYPDPHLDKPSHKGRCKARGFMRVHEETPAVNKKSWTDPESGHTFAPWPACPWYLEASRLSKR